VAVPPSDEFFDLYRRMMLYTVGIARHAARPARLQHQTSGPGSWPGEWPLVFFTAVHDLGVEEFLSV